MRSSVMKPVGGFTLNRNCAQANGLVGWWPLSPSGGGKLFDMSGRKNHLTMTSFASPYTLTSGWGFGKDGGPAVRYDGTDDYAISAASGAAVTTYPCTLMAWAKLTATPSGADSAQVVIAVGDNTSITEFRIDIVRISNVNYLRSVCEANAGANEREIRSTWVVDNGWHLFGATFIDSSNQQVYVDGVLQGGSYVTAGTGTPSPSGISKTQIGSQIYNTSSQYGPWNGLIDESRIYDRVVTASTMAMAYNPATRWQLRGQPSRTARAFKAGADWTVPPGLQFPQPTKSRPRVVSY